MNKSNILVSVCMITYNHEKYIAQAIDSVLMQKTNFDYEIVIGEDCSTDRTREIVLEYKAKHPDKFKLLLQEKNVGIHKNFTQTFLACTGKYIALLEGDDYCIDENKLQRQVDFLEKNNDYVIVFENTREINEIENTVKEEDVFLDTIELKHLLRQGWLMRTGSLLFRNGLIKDFPEWYFKFRSKDYMLHILIAQYGKIKFFNIKSSVYRKNAGGVTVREFSNDLINLYLENQKLLDLFNKFFQYKYRKEINFHKSKNFTAIFLISLRNFNKSSLKIIIMSFIKSNKIILFKRIKNFFLKELGIITNDRINNICFFESSPPFGDRLGGIATYILHRAHILSSNGFEVYWTDGLRVAKFDNEKKQWEIAFEYKADKYYKIKKRFTHLLPGIKYLLEEAQIDTIEFPDSYGYDISKLKSKCKVIIQCHTSSPVRDFLNYLPLSLRARLNAKRIKKNLLNADKILACSFEIATLTSGFYKVQLDKFNIIHHAFEKELLNASEIKCNARENYFIVVANVEYLKGIDLLLKAFIEYKNKGGKNQLFYIGPKDLFDVPSPMKERWIELGTNKLIEHIGSKYFKFIPYLSKEELLNLMSRATATIILSRFEAFTMVVGEAASVGCPIIVSNRLGWNNLINRFDAGIMVNPYNKDEVVNAMLKMEDNIISNKYSDNISKLFNYLYSDLLIKNTVNEYQFV